jgi:glycosyltransferase involved in cell wall biosynthesis
MVIDLIAQRSPRILFLCEQYPPVVWDGAGAYTAAVATALAALGLEVHVLCAQGRRATDTVVGGVHVHRRPLLRVPVSRALGRYQRILTGPLYPRDSLSLRASLSASYAVWLRRLGLRPDVIETQDGDSRALAMSLRRSFPLVIHLHCPTMLPVRLAAPGPLSLRGAVADRVDRLSSDRADVVTSPSPLMVDTLRQFGWLRDRTVEIIPNPFDASPWLHVPPPVDTGPTVLAVGRLEWAKGLDVLLDAAALLARDGLDPKIVLAGRSAGVIDGLPAASWLERRAARLGVACLFAGHLSHDELTAAYAQARVVAVPSRFESMSMAALEAMAAGRPVVTTATTGIAPYVNRYGAGAVVPTGNARALADALRVYLDDPDAAGRAGKGGRAAVAEFEPMAVARQRLEAYRRAIELFAARTDRSGRSGAA